MTFPGHAYGARNEAQLRAIARAEIDTVRSTARELEHRGLVSAALSIGSTPTVRYLSGEAAGLQIRPGNYVFNDATQVTLGVARSAQCALSVLTTVVSRPAADRIILDAGSKAISADRMTDRARGFGIVAEMPQLSIERLYEEHAIAHVPASCPLGVGDRVRVIPNHACTTVNLHSSMLLVAGGSVVDVWPVGPRGWS